MSARGCACALVCGALAAPAGAELISLVFEGTITTAQTFEPGGVPVGSVAPAAPGDTFVATFRVETNDLAPDGTANPAEDLPTGMLVELFTAAGDPIDEYTLRLDGTSVGGVPGPARTDSNTLRLIDDPAGDALCVDAREGGGIVPDERWDALVRVAASSLCIPEGVDLFSTGVIADLGDPTFERPTDYTASLFVLSAVADVGAGLDGAFEITGTVDRFSVVPDSTPCPGDADNSGAVDVNDLTFVVNRLGTTGEGDADGSGAVDVNDLTFVVNRLGDPCP